MMAGRRKRAHSVGDKPKLKLQRSVMSPMVGNEEISKNKDKNHDSSVITQQELLSYTVTTKCYRLSIVITTI